VSIHQLLLYSSVCGVGLDTVPIPSNFDPDQVARMLLDVGTMAFRLDKPLSCRLFPVPGKEAGEETEFDSPYLVNTSVMEV